MKRLHVLRHAKAGSGDAGLPDRERPLAPLGEEAARQLGEHLRSEGIAPALVLCSTALRARQTLAALLPALAGDTEIRLEEALYDAGSAEVLARVREVPEEVPSALVVGHNPALHDLALALTGAEDSLDRFPAGALATIAFSTTWAELTEGAGELEGLVVPGEL